MGIGSSDLFYFILFCLGIYIERKGEEMMMMIDGWEEEREWNGKNCGFDRKQE